MTIIKLYGHRMSQPSRAVELFMMMNNINYELKQVDFVNGETRSRDYLENVNMNGKVPVLFDDDDFVLLESHAMLRHLSRKYKLTEWYDCSDLKTCATIDQWLDWHHLNTRTYASDMFHAIVVVNFVPMMLKIEVKTLQIEDLNRKLCMTLAVLDKQLENKEFITGKVSIVDLSIGCELYQLRCYGYSFGEFPNVNRWLDNLEKLPKWLDAHSVAIQAGKDFLANDKNAQVISSVKNFTNSRL